MKEKNEIYNFEEDETEELNIEDLTDVQGGFDEDFRKGNCGLGCFIGAGYGPVIQ